MTPLSPENRRQLLLERIKPHLTQPIPRFTSRGQADFVSAAVQQGESSADPINRLKSLAKKHMGRRYMLFAHVVGPTWLRMNWSTLQTYFDHRISELAQTKDLVIQLGSGNQRIDDRIVNFDLDPYPEVDVVADCTRLPLKDSCADVVLSHAVLEHIPDPEAFLRESYRILKPGGLVFSAVPFMEGFHSSPHDYYRWTHKGLEVAHERSGFETLEVIPLSGPTSSLIWILQEWLAIVFSFNVDALYYFFLAIFSAALAPFKILDALFMRYRQAWMISSFNLYVGRKAH